MRRDFFGASSPTSFRAILANVNETQRCYAIDRMEKPQADGAGESGNRIKLTKNPDSARIGAFYCIWN